jgi:hypothetical protein
MQEECYEYEGEYNNGGIFQDDCDEGEPAADERAIRLEDSSKGDKRQREQPPVKDLHAFEKANAPHQA